MIAFKKLHAFEVEDVKWKIQFNLNASLIISFDLPLLGCPSNVIIYPCWLRFFPAFKTGNVSAFYAWFQWRLSADNFQNFTIPLWYWYLVTWLSPLLPWLLKHLSFTLAGYAYSRYNFLARKQSLVFFLDYPNGTPFMVALTAFSFVIMALMLNALNQLPWSSPLCRWRIPMNAWLMKGYFDTVPILPDESAKLMVLDTSVASGKSSFHWFAHDCGPSALWASWDLLETTSCLNLLRDEINPHGSGWSSNLYHDQKSKDCLLWYRWFWLQSQSVCVLSSSSKRTLFQAWQLVGIKDKKVF